MASAANSKPASTGKKKTLTINGEKVDQEKILAQTALQPSVQAAMTVQQWAKRFGELDLAQLVGELRAQATLATDGKLGRGEAMLMIQAHTLNTIFNELGRRAALNVGEYLGACETYLRLALKAQSQCRATLETLALMKNPLPTTFVRQANIANNQQVNNGAAESSRARENENRPNELLEVEDGNRLDSGAAITPVEADLQLATLGAIHRTKDDVR